MLQVCITRSHPLPSEYTCFHLHRFSKERRSMFSKAALLPSPTECSTVRGWLLVRDFTTHKPKVARPGFGQADPHLSISHQSDLPCLVNRSQSVAPQVSEISLLLCCHPPVPNVPGTYSIPILGYRRGRFIGCLQKQCWYQPLGA